MHAAFTGRDEGDLGAELAGPLSGALAARRRAVVDLPWTWLRQVHGSDVVTVTSPGGAAGESADAAVTATPGCALAVLTADCAPVVLSSPDGVAGVAHAGWRGLLAGVVEATVERMRSLGAKGIQATLGPCIRAGCYEFGADDLDRVADRLGPVVRARTPTGRPALDLASGVRAALNGVGVSDFHDSGICTACSASHFSWRARGERQRQATVAWVAP